MAEQGERGKPYKLGSDEFFLEDWLEGHEDAIDTLIARQTLKKTSRRSVGGRFRLEAVTHPVWDGDRVRRVLDIEEGRNVARTAIEIEWVVDEEGVTYSRTEPGHA